MASGDISTHSESGDEGLSAESRLLDGASFALLGTGIIGVTALVLHFISPWVAWGYVLVALVLGLGLDLFVTRRSRRSL